jgi:hypothetical protein
MIDASNVSNLLSIEVENDCVNEFKFVIDVTKLAVDCEAVNVFKFVIEVCNEPVSLSKTYLLSNELVNCDEPDIVPAGIVVDELINPNAVICADELTKFEGNG